MNPHAVHQLLADIASGTPSLPGAACRTRRELFDSPVPADITRAIEVCADCPARDPCSRWAAAQPARTLEGVIAGHRFHYTFEYTTKKEK